MKKKPFQTGTLMGLMLTIPLAAVLFAGKQLLSLSFPPFEIFEWLTRILPGPVVTFGIDAMIDTLRILGINVADTAKTAEQIMALGQFLVVGGITGAIFYRVWKKQSLTSFLLAGGILGAVMGLPASLISIFSGSSVGSPLLNVLWLGVMFLSWGVGLAWTKEFLVFTRDIPETPDAQTAHPGVEKIDRRQFLVWIGAGSATITVLGAGIGTLASRSRGEGQRGSQPQSPSGTAFPNAGDPVSPVPGTRAEYTPVADHYKVFISLEPPEISPESWSLPITGLVENPLTLNLDDLQNNYEAQHQYVTLNCISGRIPTSLISTTYWTGVSLQDILKDLGVKEKAQYLYITSEDGYYETVPLELVNADPRIMLCYAWDGKPLPADHGFPLRIWIPDRFGMKQPKWITGIEVIEEYREGYWVERNWDRIAQVKTRSVIDTVAVEERFQREGQTLLPIGGIAFAGAREISRVEVRVDGGEWQEAQLRSPLSDTTWVIWRFEWPFEKGQHTFEVRCYDGAGNLQVTESTPARPDGATGIHSVQETLS